MSVIFPNMNAVKKYIETAINGTLQDHVVPEVLADFAENAENKVYKVYDPFVYERSYSLMGPDTYDIENGDMESSISVVHPYGALIEYGQGSGHGAYQFPYNREGTQDQFLQPRPFYRSTVEELEGGRFKQLLAEGLKTYGIIAK